MTLQEIKKSLVNIFQGKLKNIVSLADDSTLEKDMKVLKVGEKNAPLEISESELRINGTINAEAINVDKSAVVTQAGNVTFEGVVGFDLFTPTYSASDTEINFKTDGNKAFVTFGSGNITDLNLNLPATSGNFVLLLKQDGTGSRTVTNYKVFDSGGVAANGSATVKFAGGSNPTLTTDANHVDILSFFWDADNEICYGVITLDFQF